MHLKRYRSNSVRDALAQARHDLGADALVLSTRLVGDRGWRGWMGQRVVELTAASTRDMSESRPESPSARPFARVSGAVVQDAPPPAAATAVDDPLVARLCATGLGQRTASEVAATVPSGKRRQLSIDLLQRAIADTLSPLVAPDTAFAPAEVFVGPPGVGKTTTIAKIAAQERARRGALLGLVAADGFRVGAVEQLRTYADIIGAPFSVARSVGELDTVLEQIGRTPVLIDTAGRGFREAPTQELLARLGGWTGIRTHLVMSATTAPRDAARLIDAYAVARPARVVLTRLDEAPSIGPLVALLREHRLPVSFLGTGQRVPEDLARATAERLAGYVLGEHATPDGDLA